ncbi:MAG TPA: hypothetical protein VMS17_31105 [Gemmataceae bacterium]|nr:hypothetical protein [Gemmataceae bacterium]
MTDLQPNESIPVARLADPPPAAVYGVPPPRTNWGPLILAFFLGGFTSFLATSLLAVVVVWYINSLGEKAHNTFEYVSDKVQSSGSPTPQNDAGNDRANNTFQRVSDVIGRGDDVFKRVDPPIHQDDNDPPFKDKP